MPFQLLPSISWNRAIQDKVAALMESSASLSPFWTIRWSDPYLGPDHINISLCRKWPLPSGADCWQCSMTWSPEPPSHSSSSALVTRWDAQWRGSIVRAMISPKFFADIWDSRDPNCRWCLELSDGPWLWDVDDLQDHDCGFIFRCWLPPPGFEGTDRQWSNWGY